MWSGLSLPLQPRLTAQQSYSALATLPFLVLWSPAPLHAGLAHTALCQPAMKGLVTPHPVYVLLLSHFSSQLEIHSLITALN